MATLHFVSSAPGKVILSGEHSVVHSRLALATVIERRSFARFDTRVGGEVATLILVTPATAAAATPTVSSFSWPLEQLRAVWAAHTNIAGCPQLTPSDHRSPIDALLDALIPLHPHDGTKTEQQTCAVFLFLLSVFCAQQPSFRGVKVRVSTELPLSSGLGSSAAYAVSLAQGFWHLRRCSTAVAADTAATAASDCAPAPLSHDELVLVNRWSFECERMMHGNPSGVDNTVATFGGALAFRRGFEPIVLSRVRPLRMLVVDTRQTRDTKRLVAGVGERLLKHTAVMVPMLDAMHQIALSVAQIVAPEHAAEVALLANATTAAAAVTVATSPEPESDVRNEASADQMYTELVDLFIMNQALLNGIGVGHAVLDRVCDIARTAHFPGAKLTGAGGGGCALVLLPWAHDSIAALVDALQLQGFQTFETTIGGTGAQLRAERASDE